MHVLTAVVKRKKKEIAATMANTDVKENPEPAGRRLLESVFTHAHQASLTVVFDLSVFLFFQAEDGIRDLYVTGVQTCALPISALADFVASLPEGLDTRVGER